MKRLLLAAIAVFLCLAAFPAQAQFGHILLPPRDANQGYKLGKDVLSNCVAPEQIELMQCLGFLEASSDAFVQERAEAGMPPCYPASEKVDLVEIQHTLVAYLIAHPEHRPELGAKVVRDAIIARWCTPPKAPPARR